MLSRIWAQFVSNDYLIDAAPDRKYYEILLSQVGTGAPTASVKNNTLGTVTFSYVDVGVWRMNSSSLFTAGKTMIYIGDAFRASDLLLVGAERLTSSVIELSQIETGAGPANGCSNVTIKIEVFN